jgi:hypothetical protein
VVAAAATIVVYTSNLSESLLLFHIFLREPTSHIQDEKNDDIISNIKKFD